MLTNKNHYRFTSHAFHKQGGIGMVEILVTLLVLSIGLLGVASLQFVGSFNNKDALARTQGIMAAQQLSERLRASAVLSQVTDGYVVNNNYFEPLNYNFENLNCASQQSDFNCFCVELPPEIPDCRAGVCNADDIAIYDAYQVSCSLVRELPNASIALSCNDNNSLDTDACTAGSTHEILVKWPIQSWQGHNTKSNERCDDSSTDSYDCVILELHL